MRLNDLTGNFSLVVEFFLVYSQVTYYFLSLQSYIFCTSVIAIGLQLTSIAVLKHFGHEVGLPPAGLYLFVF